VYAVCSAYTSPLESEAGKCDHNYEDMPCVPPSVYMSLRVNRFCMRVDIDQPRVCTCCALTPASAMHAHTNTCRQKRLGGNAYLKDFSDDVLKEVMRFLNSKSLPGKDCESAKEPAPDRTMPENFITTKTKRLTSRISNSSQHGTGATRTGMCRYTPSTTLWILTADTRALSLLPRECFFSNIAYTCYRIVGYICEIAHVSFHTQCATYIGLFSCFYSYVVYDIVYDIYNTLLISHCMFSCRMVSTLQIPAAHELHFPQCKSYL